MHAVMGITMALHARTNTGRGQVIDAAMTEGAASLMATFYGRVAAGHWRDARGVKVSRPQCS